MSAAGAIAQIDQIVAYTSRRLDEFVASARKAADIPGLSPEMAAGTLANVLGGMKPADVADLLAVAVLRLAALPAPTRPYATEES